MTFELMLSGKLASADVAEMRPLAGVRLKVDDELRPAFELFTAQVAEQRARPLRLRGALHVDALLVVLEVVCPHVGFGAEVAEVRFDPRVDDLMRLQPGPAVEGFPADGAQPSLHLALLLQLGDAVGVQPGQVVLQIVAAVEAKVAEVAGERLLPRVDEGVTCQTGLVLHHFATHVTHDAVHLQLHQRAVPGLRVQPHVPGGRRRRSIAIWGNTEEGGGGGQSHNDSNEKRKMYSDNKSIINILNHKY